MTTSQTNRNHVPPTERQLAYLRSLLEQRTYPRYGATRDERIATLDDRLTRPAFDKFVVMNLIDVLRTQSFDPVAAEENGQALKAGVYERNGEIYVVKPNRKGTNLYAKKLVEINGKRLTEEDEVVTFELVYAPGAIRNLRAADLMPFVRAQELTIRYRRCLYCGRGLEAAESVERGIGPVCAKKFA
jgi:Family of unknown function (DUF6011)